MKLNSTVKIKYLVKTDTARKMNSSHMNFMIKL